MSRFNSIGFLLLVALSIAPTRASSQTADSLTQSMLSSGALQFQLYGGLGVFYIGPLGRTSHYRIGADVAYSHFEQESTYDDYGRTIAEPSTYSSTRYVTAPNEVTNSYQVTVSALYLQQLAEYTFTQLYCGIGPHAQYFWTRSAYSYSSDRRSFAADTTYFHETGENSGAQTTKSSGAGALVIFGVRSRVYGHVALSAEIGLTAAYQWGRRSSEWSSSTSSAYEKDYAYTNTNTERTKGWNISLNSIRVGLIVGL